MSYLHSLSVFCTVVEEKSFSAAGKKLALTQPTVSFHIDNLEKKFDCPLFIRTAKGVTLTIYGEKLYTNTQKIHCIAAETENHIKTLVAGYAGEINIVLQVSGNQALKTAILGQAGIGFISTWAIQEELADGRLTSIPLPGIELERTFYTVRNMTLSPTCVESFWQFLNLYSF